MGSMTRRMQRNARRRLGALVDKVLDTLDYLEDLADAADDREAFELCSEAVSAIDATLTPDGLPTPTTAAVLPEIVAGPFTLALQRLRPDLPLPPEASHALISG
jgi:hypothetical protein